jgi:MFS family permease
MTDALIPADSPPPASQRWLPRLLRGTPFRRYWSAHTVSLFGDEISALALPLFAVLVLHAGPAQMGLLIAAALIPNLLFSMLAGAWIDRRPRKRQIMIVADIGRALLLAAVPLAFFLDVLTIEHLYVVAFLSGTLALFFALADSVLFVALVPKKDYVEANTLLHGSRATSYVAGPGIGGILVQTLTAPIALLADAVSYVVSAALLLRIRPTEPAPSDAKGLGIGQGLRFIAQSPVNRSILLATTTLNLFNYMFTALFVLYVSTELGIPPAMLGAVFAAGAIGSLIGAAVTGRVVRKFGIGRALVLSLVLFPAPLILVPLAGGATPLVLGMLFLAEFLCGLGLMMLDITDVSMQNAVIPDALRARVWGAERTINYGIRPVGALLGGTLGAALGVRPTLWIATVGALAGVLWVLFSPVARLRELPDSVATHALP